MEEKQLPYVPSFLPAEVQREAKKRAPNTLTGLILGGTAGAILGGPAWAFLGGIIGGFMGYGRDTEHSSTGSKSI